MPHHRVFEQDGGRVVCDTVSLEFLRGSTLEFEDTLMRAAFTVGRGILHRAILCGAMVAGIVGADARTRSVGTSGPCPEQGVQDQRWGPYGQNGSTAGPTRKCICGWSALWGWALRQSCQGGPPCWH